MPTMLPARSYTGLAHAAPVVLLMVVISLTLLAVLACTRSHELVPSLSCLNVPQLPVASSIHCCWNVLLVIAVCVRLRVPPI